MSDELTPKPMPATPGLVVTPPGTLPDSIPYEKQFRIAEALTGLLTATANTLQVEVDVLVAIRGAVCEHGSAALIHHYDRPFGNVVGRVVVSYDARRAEKLFLTEWQTDVASENRYGRTVEALNV